MKLSLSLLLIITTISATKAELATNFNNKSPINITSDDLDVDQEKNQATFTGNVIITQDDIEINSDKMVVFFVKKENKKGLKQPIKQEPAKEADLSSQLANIYKISASGNVKFFGDEKKAYANSADYIVDKKLLEMHNKVKLVHNQSVIYGDKLIYDLKNNKAKVISNKYTKSHVKERVKLIINQNKK